MVGLVDNISRVSYWYIHPQFSYIHSQTFFLPHSFIDARPAKWLNSKFVILYCTHRLLLWLWPLFLKLKYIGKLYLHLGCKFVLTLGVSYKANALLGVVYTRWKVPLSAYRFIHLVLTHSKWWSKFYFSSILHTLRRLQLK